MSYPRRGVCAVIVGLFGIALTGAACRVDEVDFEGKRCPCAAGYVCDSETRRCVLDEPRATSDPDDASPDGGTSEADAGHAGTDAGRLDPDAGTSSERDAAPVDGGVPDARVVDAADGLDASTRDPVLLESAFLDPENTSTRGLSLNDAFWPGWRFELTEVSEVLHIGHYAAPGSGTAFAAIVALDGRGDGPDAADLTSDDVVFVGTMELRDARGDVSLAPPGVVLEPGWYAIVFGTGAHGAGGTSRGVPTGHPPVEGAALPFAIRQSDGALILQARGPRFFVEARPR